MTNNLSILNFNSSVLGGGSELENVGTCGESARRRREVGQGMERGEEEEMERRREKGKTKMEVEEDMKMSERGKRRAEVVCTVK